MSLLLLLMLVLMVWALVEVAQADRSQIRLLSKPVWIILIVIAQPVGSIVWFVLGRPKEGVPGGPPQQRPSMPNWPGRTQLVDRPAPDDDPEFLANLKRQAERERRAREQQQRDTAPEPED
ncbi:MAG: PLD nuclease N-terminal domain-containing protein [Sporichthyaceae bacterium]